MSDCKNHKSAYVYMTRGMDTNRIDASDVSSMNKLLEFLKNINSWRRVLMLAAISTIFLMTYYGYVEINRIGQLANINPWKYFEMRHVDDPEGLEVVLDDARETLGCDMIAVMLYQPKDEYYFETLSSISPRGKYTDFEQYSMKLPLHYLHKLQSEIHDAGLSCITSSSGHYDSKLMIVYNMQAAYAIPIKARDVIIGHIMFVYKRSPSTIPLYQMVSTVECVLLKIF